MEYTFGVSPGTLAQPHWGGDHDAVLREGLRSVVRADRARPSDSAGTALACSVPSLPGLGLRVAAVPGDYLHHGGVGLAAPLPAGDGLARYQQLVCVASARG